jgi:hypothetical protein
MSTWWTPQQAERGRLLAEQEARSNWDLGDLALEIVPEGVGRVGETLEAFGDEIGVSGIKLKDCRRTAAAWPKQYRVTGAPWTLHRDFGVQPDRWEQLPEFVRHCQDRGLKVNRPNLWKFTGKKPWDSETRARVEGQLVPPTAADIAHAVAQDPKLAEQVVAHKDARQAFGSAAERHYAGERAHVEHRREHDPVVAEAEQASTAAELMSTMWRFAQDVGRLAPGAHIEQHDSQFVAALQRVAQAVELLTGMVGGTRGIDEELAELLQKGA